MSDAWHSVKIKQFEHVMVGPSIALLRVAAKPRRKAAAKRRPTLVADDGHVVLRFAAIPSPPDVGVLRAAYSVPAEVITPDTVFSLELGDVFVVSLPTPTPGAARLGAETSADRPPDPLALAGAALEHAADERRWEVTSKLSQLSAALGEFQRAAAEDKSARASAEAAQAAAEAAADRARGEARALADRVAQLEAERDDRVAEAQRDGGRRVAELLAETERRTAAAQAQAAGRVAEARAEADRRVAEAEAALQQRLSDVELSIQEYQARAEAQDRELEQSAATLNELEIWRGELERRLTATTTELGAARGRLQEDEQQLERLRGQLADAEARAERAQTEIEALRHQATLAAHATGEPDPDRDTEAARRLRELESERDRLARRAAHLSELLEPAEHLAEVARGFTEARALAAGLQSALTSLGSHATGEASAAAGEAQLAAGGEDGALEMPRTTPNGQAAPAVPRRSADAAAAIEAISRRAEAEASEQAARELAEAADEARSGA